jgi:hypothetical protein
MKRLKKYNSLFEMAPPLVKEWHPTANGNLTPRNLEVVYPGKIWWICSESHEWQATIKNRMNQNDCPFCEKEAAKKKVDLSLSIPTIGKNYRNNRRFKTKVTAVIELPNSGHWLYADMKDLSSHGLNLETEAAIQPGTVIRIKFDKALVSSRLDKSLKSLFNDGDKTYNSTVRWCKKLDDDQSMSNFGIGVKLL